jgi:AraC family transcriptional regulator
MTKTTLEQYHARMQRVLDYVDQHLDEELGLETLSQVAAFSKHHFHRQFTAIFGISVHRYVQLIRMKRASYRLVFRTNDTVTDIAMDAGYEAPETFARAFKQQFGQAPTAFRRSPEWGPWLAAFGPLTGARTIYMKNTFTVDQVKIIDAAPTTIALMEHRGDPRHLGRSIQRFIAWRKATGLAPKTSATFTIFHDPEPARPEDFRIDLCAATDRPIAANDEGVKPGLIPGGRCALLRVVGSSENMGPAASFLYREWMPESGEEARDFPLYCQRVTFFPDVAEHETVTDLLLPLK